jgi:hypothetical protein
VWGNHRTHHLGHNQGDVPMRGTVRHIGLALCLLVLLSSALQARTWYIKEDGTGDAPTIQAGIDSAAHPDSVLVAGTAEFQGSTRLTKGGWGWGCQMVLSGRFGRLTAGLLP